MTSSRIYIGIDNGLDGALVALDGDGELLESIPMPTRKLGKGREVDVERVHDWLGRFAATVILEEAAKHSPGKLALCSTWHSFGMIKAVLRLDGIRHEIVPPKRWQKAFWTTPKLPKGQKFDTKAAALSAASRLWPAETWLASPRCSAPHSGLVDAALLAEYGRRTRI